MKRSKPLARTSRLARGARIKAVNRPRRASEFQRCYHSRERVRWVKGLGCLVCLTVSPLFYTMSAGKCDNAHVGGNGGMGRKGPYTEIVPLCRKHHRLFDEHRFPCDVPELRGWLLKMAGTIETHWQAHLNATRHAA